MSDCFKEATRLKLRVATPRGVLTVEDLWDLPTMSSAPERISLNSVAIQLNKELKEHLDLDFISETPKTYKGVEIMFECVKEVIQYRKAEAERKAKQVAIDRLKEAKERKKLESITNMTVEELEARIKELEADAD